MADRILLTTDDLEHAVRVNAQLEAAGFETTLTSSLDDVRQSVQRRDPDCIILTGGLHDARPSISSRWRTIARSRRSAWWRRPNRMRPGSRAGSDSRRGSSSPPIRTKSLPPFAA